MAMATGALGFAGCATLVHQPRKPRPIAAGAKVRYAQIGFGGRGHSDLLAQKDEEVVALCDIDWGRPNVQQMFAEFPQAKRYKDFRQMLLEMDDRIDAVGIATADHMHFLPAYMSIMLGKHVYLQKPLAPTVGELRELLRLSRLNGVCTQMGNQGHAGEGIRLVKEWIEAGVLGDVREVKIWTDRPVWPQGFTEWPMAQPVPEGLAWDRWLGRAATRPFSPKIHPFKWRGFQEYGCGALGDMAPHLMDAAFWGLELGAPSSVEVKRMVRPSPIAFPRSAIIEYQFPPRGERPGVKLTWHEGGLRPDRPEQLELERPLSKSGQLIIGSKETLFDGTDYCFSPRIIPEARHRELRPTLPARTIPRPVPVGNSHKEWMTAIRAGNPALAGSNFEYSVPFTEMIVLGVAALIAGKGFTWDAAAMSSNLAEVNRGLYPTYRHGWNPRDMA